MGPVRDAVGKRWEENAKSIRSLKKNIADHKDYMANPKNTAPIGIILTKASAMA